MTEQPTLCDKCWEYEPKINFCNGHNRKFGSFKKRKHHCKYFEQYSARRAVCVTKEPFAEKMLEHFKIVNQGYPQTMQDILRKQWQVAFQDMTDAGFLIVEKEALLKVKADLEDILNSDLMKEAAKLIGAYVRDRWSGQLGVILELIGVPNK